jgi:hypothetical protein
MTYTWYEAYKSAILETDRTKIPERLRSAELEIHERQHILSLDHGGTPEERQAIDDALNGMKVLHTFEWYEGSAYRGRNVANSATAERCHLIETITVLGNRDQY